MGNRLLVHIRNRQINTCISEYSSLTDRNTIERGNEKVFENIYINDAIKMYAFNGASLGNIIIIKTGKIYVEYNDIYIQTRMDRVQEKIFLKCVIACNRYWWSANTIVYYQRWSNREIGSESPRPQVFGDPCQPDQPVRLIRSRALWNSISSRIACHNCKSMSLLAILR